MVVSIDTFDEMASEIILIPNEKVVLEIERDGTTLVKETTIASVEEVDRFGNKYRIGRIGVGASQDRNCSR